MQSFQIVLTALAIPAVTAFAPSTTKVSSTTTTLNAGKTYMNGWSPEDSTTKFCYGLPGSVVSFSIQNIYLFIYLFISHSKSNSLHASAASRHSLTDKIVRTD